MSIEYEKQGQAMWSSTGKHWLLGPTGMPHSWQLKEQTWMSIESETYVVGL